MRLSHPLHAHLLLLSRHSACQVTPIVQTCTSAGFLGQISVWHYCFTLLRRWMDSFPILFHPNSWLTILKWNLKTSAFSSSLRVIQIIQMQYFCLGSCPSCSLNCIQSWTPHIPRLLHPSLWRVVAGLHLHSCWRCPLTTNGWVACTQSWLSKWLPEFLLQIPAWWKWTIGLRKNRHS